MRERRDVNEGTVTQLPRRRAHAFSIAGRRFGRAVLIRRWAAAATASLQCTYAEWFDPTVVEVAHAVVGFGDLDAALDAFVGARIAAHFSLPGTAADLQALLSVTPSRFQDRFDRVDLARRISRAWPTTSAVASPAGEISGGLAARVRAACGRVTSRIGVAHGPTLLVVDGDVDHRDQLAVAAVRWIDEIFPAAEVLGSVGGGRFLAVVHSHQAAPDPAALLGTVLRASPGGDSATVTSRPWPAAVDAALALVSRLVQPEVTAALAAEPDVAPAASVLAFPVATEPVPVAATRSRRSVRAAAGVVTTAAAALAMILTGGTIGEIHSQTAIGPGRSRGDVPAAPAIAPATNPATVGSAVAAPVTSAVANPTASATRTGLAAPAPATKSSATSQSAEPATDETQPTDVAPSRPVLSLITGPLGQPPVSEIRETVHQLLSATPIPDLASKAPGSARSLRARVLPKGTIRALVAGRLSLKR